MDTETTKKTLVLNRKVKTAEIDHIHQSFSRGRTKTVTVEVKKRRGFKKADDDQGLNKDSIQSSKDALLGERFLEGSSQTLTTREVEARIEALKKAEERKKEDEAFAAIVAEGNLSEIDNGDGDLLGVDGQKFDVDDKNTVIAQPDGMPGDAISSDSNREGALKRVDIRLKPRGSEDDPEAESRGAWKKSPKKSIKEDSSLGLGGRRQKRISIYDAMAEEQERIRSLAAVRRTKNKGKKSNNIGADTESKKFVREVIIPEVIEVQELANRMAVRSGDLIKALLKLGVVATINQALDGDTAELVVSEFGHKVKRVGESDVEEGMYGDQDDAGCLVSRAPIITVMGHVDHGKTSLLDAFRKTDVAAKEAGGITQHIGAYQVKVPDGRKITFIDTPGHEAFTEMRVRGANVTDMVILVVAADDSVKEQSIEAINHARAAEVPIIVAINKIDKSNASPDRVKQDLLRYEVVAESLGGDVIVVEVSAKTGKGLDSLLEAILAQAEMLDLKANPNRSGKGTVIESRQERGFGPVATILVEKGTLKRGDIFVSGRFSGRIRAMTDYLGNKVELALPSMPVEVIGFDGNPSPGSDFVVMDDEVKAREIAQYRDRKIRVAEHALTTGDISVEQMFSNLVTKDGIKELPLVIKADVQGSIEAISFSLQKLSTSEVAVRILHSGVGEITESDVSLAKASKALVVGFNVRANIQGREVAQRDAVSIKYYSIIYDLIDEVTARLSGLLSPELREKSLGTAEVRRVFDIKKTGKIAGCMVLSGLIRRGAKVRILRDNMVIHKGDLSSLMRMKDEVKEVREGFECGIGIENYQDIHEGDSIECFMIEEIERKL